MVIDVGQTSTKQMVVGSIVLGGIGLIAIISALAGAVSGGGEVAVLIIGLVFLLLGLLPLIKARTVFRPRKLIVESGGIRWDDPQGKPWAVAWSEISAVSINKHGKLQTPESMQDKIVGAAVEKVAGEHVMVRLDLYPADPGFRARHPEMEHMWELHSVKGGYRMPLGRNPNFIPPLANALAFFGQHVYRGVQVTEGFMGLT